MTAEIPGNPEYGKPPPETMRRSKDSRKKIVREANIIVANAAVRLTRSPLGVFTPGLRNAARRFLKG